MSEFIPGRGEKRGGKLFRPDTRLAALLALLATQDVNAAPPIGVAQAETISANAHAEAEQGSFWPGYEGTYFPIYDAKHGGFDWRRLIEPMYVGVSHETAKPQTISFEVPYEYARLFDKGNPLDEKDYEAAKAFMADQVRSQLVDNLHGFSWDESHFTEHAPHLDQSWNVDAISVEGFASPEASGMDSVVPGEVEDANLELGKIRAEDSGARLKEVLEDMGMNVDNVVARYTGDELQFSKEEWAQLMMLADAQGYKGVPEEKIWRLISDYNLGKAPADVQEQLDSLVGSKRVVQVEVNLKDKGKETYLVPVPLLALLLLWPGKKGGEALRDWFKNHPWGGQKREPILDAKPTTPKSAEQFTGEVIDDLDRNMGTYELFVDRYDGKEVDVNELTHDILEHWNWVDNSRRKYYRQPSEDHKLRPQQVWYANLHARAISQLLAEKAATGIIPSQAIRTNGFRSRFEAIVQAELKRVQQL